MELVIYNRLNTVSNRIGERMVFVSQTAGTITLSAQLGKDMNLKKGDQIIMAQEKNSPKVWFLACAKPADELAFVVKEIGKRLGINSNELTKRITDSFKKTESLKFLASKTPVNIDGVSYIQLLPILNN